MTRLNLPADPSPGQGPTETLHYLNSAPWRPAAMPSRTIPGASSYQGWRHGNTRHGARIENEGVLVGSADLGCNTTKFDSANPLTDSGMNPCPY